MADSIDFGADMKLNQFQNDFFKNMNTFWKNGLYCDVTLLVNGTQFHCHRLILSMASPYFQAMFNGDFKESKSAVIAIKEIGTDIMDQILNAVYSAQLQLLPENVYFVLKASHFLQISAIVDRCVACVIKNPRICYLTETYSFARSFDLRELYDVCLEEIGNDLKRWGRTDAIKKLPFDVLSSILLNGNFTQMEDEIFLLIIKWSEYTNATSTEIRRLLELSAVKGPIISPSIVAELISNIDNSCALVKNEDYKDNAKLDSSDFTFCFNVYLNGIDEETGAAGCGLLKLNDNFEFDGFPTLHTFHNVSSFDTKICKIGSKIYCWESDSVSEKYNFFCWENFKNDEKLELQVPEDIHWCESKSYDIVTMGSMICFISKVDESDIWGYDSQHNSWCKMFEQIDPIQNENLCPALYECLCDWLAVTVLGNVLYIIGVHSPRFIISFDSRTPTTRIWSDLPEPFDHEYVAVCTFDGKIAISGSNYGAVPRNVFYIYDPNADDWWTDIKPKNNSQANYKLVYRDGFIYALGNSSIVANEKYDITSNTWTDIPSLPKRLLVKNNRDMVISTGYVMYVD